MVHMMMMRSITNISISSSITTNQKVLLVTIEPVMVFEEAEVRQLPAQPKRAGVGVWGLDFGLRKQGYEVILCGYSSCVSFSVEEGTSCGFCSAVGAL